MVLTRRDKKLFQAAASGNCNAARIWIEAKADVNATDEEQMTPLHWAANQGHIDVARLLLRNGASRSAKDVRNRTPEDIAAGLGRNDLAKILKAPRQQDGHTAGVVKGQIVVRDRVEIDDMPKNTADQHKGCAASIPKPTVTHVDDAKARKTRKRERD
jgi:uncharacterized protein